MWLPEYGLSHSWVRMLSCIDMHWVNGCLLKSRKKTCHGSYYIDLAGPESEALDNIYSLLKQNIKSCNAKAAKATRTGKKNNNNKRFNQQKSNFARAAHFFCTFLCRCLAQLQHVTRVIEEMSYVFLFTFFLSPSLIFTLVAANISHFLTAVTKFSCWAPTENVSFVFFPLALALFFSLSFACLLPYFLFFSVLLFLYIPNL